MSCSNGCERPAPFEPGSQDASKSSVMATGCLEPEKAARAVLRYVQKSLNEYRMPDGTG
jgi:hypothetical protein